MRFTFQFLYFLFNKLGYWGGTNYVDCKRTNDRDQKKWLSKNLASAGFLNNIDLKYTFDEINNLSIVINDGINPSVVFIFA